MCPSFINIDQHVRQRGRLGGNGVSKVGGVRGRGVVGSDCASGTEETQAATIDLRTFNCTEYPASLRPELYRDDDRYFTRDFTCLAPEVRFMDDNLPVYRALSAGDVPGESAALLGWVNVGRDIDRSPSAGSTSAFTRLGSLTDTEPTCAQVRAAFAGD